MSNPRFSIVPAWIITDSRLKGRDLQVLCLLGTYTNKEGWCRRSQVKMAEQLGCGRTTVQDSLNRLADIGVIEKLRVDSADGRDSAHWYRVILDRAVSRDLISAWAGEADEENDPISATELSSTPAGIPAPPAGSRPAPPAGSGPAPINDRYLTTQPNEKERAPERDARGSDGAKNPIAAQRSEIPGTAEFQKRLQRFLAGEGYSAGEWPLWAKGASFDYHEKQFARLSEEERKQAEASRDAILSKWRRDGIPDGKIMGPGNYFKGRIWEMLTAKDRSLAAGAVNGVPAKPDNWATAYGPVHAAAWFRILLTGPDRPEFAPAAGAIWLRGAIRQAWPRLDQFMTLTDLKRGILACPSEQAAADFMHFVPFASDVMAGWRSEFRRRGWPDLPSPAGMTGLYLPPGDPEAAMGEMMKLLNEGKGDHDAA